MKAFKLFLIGIVTFFFISAASILRPVPIVPETECLVDKGEVQRIYEAGVNDIVFVPEGNNQCYYINRGLEQGMTSAGLQAQLIGKSITMKYPKYWTPLDWNERVKHISLLEYDGEKFEMELINLHYQSNNFNLKLSSS